MKRKQIIWLIVLTQAMVFCKKQTYPESVVENEVVYYSRMTVDGKPVEINAGVDNYYLYSSHAQDSNGVYNFVSRFANSDCETCPNTLQIQLTDHSNSPTGSAVAIDSALQPGSRKFLREGRGPFYTVEFESTYNRTATDNNFNWDFGNGELATGFKVARSFQFPGPYQVCLNVKGNNGCSSTNCNLLNFQPTQLRAFVSSKNIGQDSVQFKATVSGGKAPYTYSWNFGDGTIGAGSAASHKYSASGAYGVSVIVRDASGTLVNSNYNAVTNTDNSSCAANYSISSISTSTNGIQNWSKANIRYTTAEGTTYSSMRTDQPTDAVFEIISVEPGGTNEKGELIKKVKLKFSATLFGGSGTIKIQNGEAVIAISYH